MFHISGFFDEAASSLEGQLALAGQLGVHRLCPRKLDGRNIAAFTPEQFAQQAAPLLKKAGVTLSALGSPIGKIALEDDKAYQTQLRQLANLADIAQAQGCRYIRIFSFYMKPGFDEEQAFPLVLEKLQSFLEVVRSKDVILLHENEKKIFGDTPQRCMRLFDALHSPQFRLCCDVSNYLQCGCDAWQAYEQTRAATDEYHMKDCSGGFEVPLGLGQGCIQKILADLAAQGFEGCLTLEPHLQKYALLRRPLRVLPFLAPKAARACSGADRKCNLSFVKKLSLREAFVLQHACLIQLLDELEVPHD